MIRATDRFHTLKASTLWAGAAFVALALACAGVAWAGSDGRKGPAGAIELQIPVGPRGTALGGTVASDITGIESIFFNPAGLDAGSGTEALISHQDYFADMNLNYGAVASKVGVVGTLGVFAKVLSIGDIVVTTEQAPEGTGEILHPTFSVLGLSWAKQFTDRVNFGMTTSYVAEEIADNTARGVSFDFGVQYATDWKGLRVGMAMKNVGTTMSYSGPGFEYLDQDPTADPNAPPRVVSYTGASFEMPSYFVLATSMDVQRSSQYRTVVLAAFQNNNFSGNNLRGGVEWLYRDMGALRASYYGTFNGTTDAQTGEESFSWDSGDDLYDGWALGGGVKTKLGDGGGLGLDIAWRPAREPFNDTVEMALKFSF